MANAAAFQTARQSGAGKVGQCTSRCGREQVGAHGGGFTYHGDVGDDDLAAATQCLLDGESVSFADRGAHQCGGSAVQRGELSVADPSGEDDKVRRLVLDELSVHRVDLLGVPAHRDESSGARHASTGGDQVLDEPVESLVWVRQAHEEEVGAREAEASADRVDFRRWPWMEDGAVDASGTISMRPNGTSRHCRSSSPVLCDTVTTRSARAARKRFSAAK